MIFAKKIGFQSFWYFQKTKESKLSTEMFVGRHGFSSSQYLLKLCVDDEPQEPFHENLDTWASTVKPHRGFSTFKFLPPKAFKKAG